MKFVLLLTLFSIVTFAAVENVITLKNKLNEKSSQVMKLGAQIKSLENELNKNNEHYLKKLKDLKQLDSKVLSLKEELKESQSQIEKEKFRLVKLLEVYLLEKHEEDDSSYIKIAVVKDAIRKELEKIKILSSASQRLSIVIQDYSYRLSEVKNSEQEIYDLIVELENKKKSASEDYISTLDAKNKIELNLENILAESRAKKSQGINKTLSQGFIFPIKKYINYQASKQGITFNFDSVEPLLASSNGQVEYAGELANYGKVIILKHDQDIRSVILGEIDIRVKKGQTLRQADILGYTKASQGIKKSFYYEIREKNKVQDTLSWFKASNTKLL